MLRRKSVVMGFGCIGLSYAVISNILDGSPRTNTNLDAGRANEDKLIDVQLFRLALCGGVLPLADEVHVCAML